MIPGLELKNITDCGKPVKPALVGASFTVFYHNIKKL
jgi:hypothetical protein